MTKRTLLFKFAFLFCSTFIILKNAHSQVATKYVFSQTFGTYTPITGGTVLAAATDVTTSSTVSLDNGVFAATIPFNFSFNGTVYTSVNAHANGFITFGATPPVVSTTTPISTTTAYDGAVAPMAKDLWGLYGTSGTRTSGSNVITGVTSFTGLAVGKILRGTGIVTGTTVTSFNVAAGTITMSAAASATSTSYNSWPTGEIRAEAIGVAPNRTFVIQYSGMSDYATATPADCDLGFQIHLNEGGGIATSQSIHIVYAPSTNLSTTARTNQVGLRGLTVSDFNNRSSATDWNTTTAGTLNSSTVTRTNLIAPASGLTFIWSPIAPCTDPPTAGTASSSAGTALICPSSAVTLSLTGNSSGTGQTYQWQSSASLSGTYTNTGSVQSAPGLTVNPTSDIYYRCAVTCGTSTTYSFPVLVSVSPGLPAGTYTIDLSRVTGGSNFQTFSEAATALACGIQGPIVFNIAPGTYTEQVVLGQINNTSATNTVSFIGAGKASTILTNTGTSAADMITVLLNGTDHITFRDMTIASPGVGFGVGILLTNSADSNMFVNLDIVMNNTSTATTTAGIALSGSLTALTTTGNNGNYNTFDSLTVTGAYYGITFYGSSSSSYLMGNKVSHSSFLNQYYYGIRTYYHSGFRINYNVIRQMRNTTQYAIYNYYGSNYNINANTTTTNGTGIYNYYSNTYLYNNAVETKIYNNMVLSDANYGMYTVSSDNVKIWHNTISASGTGTIATVYFSATNGIDCRNNIFVNTGAGNVVNLSSTALFSALNYNNYYSSSNGTALVTGIATYADLASWKTAQPTLNINSFSSSPRFVSATNLHLHPLDADLKGINLGVNVDIDNAVRSNPPSIGADEKMLLYNSASLVEILPATICPGPVPVQLKVVNVGKNIINSLMIEWELDGSAQPPITYTTAIDTVGGIGNSTVLIPLGTVTYTSHTLTSIKAWISLPNGSADPMMEDDTLVSSQKPSLAGSFTIASSGADFSTFTDAVNYINNYGICGPVHFTAAAGTYTERIILNPVKGTSATNTVTFAGADKATTILTNTATAAADMITVLLNGADHITFRDMTIASPHLTYGVGILLTNAADSNTFTNLNIVMNNASTATTTAGVALSGSLTSVTTSGNNGNYNLFDSLTVTGAYYGITFTGISTTVFTKKNTVARSVFSNQYYYVMRNYQQDQFIFFRNTINTPRNTTNYGIYNYYAANYRIEKNSISSRTGIYSYYSNKSMYDNALPTRIVNNMIMAGTDNGLYFSSSDSVKVYHNSVISSGTAASATIQFATTSGIDCRNNIFVNTSATGAAVNLATTAGFTFLDYNNYYTSGISLVYVSASLSYPTLAAWKSAMPSLNVHGSSKDPMFTAANDLHLQAAGPLFFGAPLGVTTDIDGDLRSATLPTAGADEKPVPPINAGIVELVSPKGILCSGNYDIRVKLRNKGQTIINTVDVEWEMNGVLQSTINISSPIDTAGSLAGNDSIISLGSHFLAANAVINLKVWSANPNGSPDPVTADDTLYTSIGAALNGPVTIGGTTPDYTTLSSAAVALTSYGVCGPVTFNIAPGTYTERLVIGQIPGASAVNKVSFIGAGRSATTITNAGTATTDMITVLLNGTDHVTFRDMTIASTGLAYGVGVLLTNIADSNTFINMDIVMNNASTSATTAGIALSGSLTSATATGNNGSYNVFDSLLITGAYYGISLNGASSTNLTKGNNISRSVFTNQNYYAIRSYYHRDFTFEYNTISGLRSTTHYGIYNYYGSDININANTVNVTGSSDAIYSYYTNAYLHDPAIISRVSNNMVRAGTGSALSFSSADSVHIWHNSVVSGGTSTTATAYFSSCSGIDLRNNILVNTSTASGNTIYAPTSTTFTALDYNDYYAYGTGLIYTTTTLSTLAAWKAAAPAFNIRSYSQDPLFVSATDLHLQFQTPLSVMRGDVTGLAKDIDGNLRAAIPTIGADEAIVAANSAAAIALLPNAACPGFQDIQVKVLNKGSNIINTLTIDWSIDGSLQAPVTYTTPIDIMGSTAGAEAIVSLGGNTFIPGVQTNIRAWVSMPNGMQDPNTADDTIVRAIRPALSNPIYTIGATGADYATITAAVNDLNANGSCGSIVFNIKNGTYNEQFTIQSFFQSNPLDSVVFQSEGGDTALVYITFPSATASTANYIAALNGTHNVKFKNLTFQRTGTNTYSTVFNLNNTQGISFTGNHFIGPAVTSTNTDGSKSAIFSDDTNTEDSTVIHGNRFTANGNGIWLFSNISRSGAGTVISGNTFLNAYSTIFLKHHKAPQVHHNTITRPVAGAFDFYGINLENCDSSLRISHNSISYNRGYGIRLLGSRGTVAARGQIYNNMISGNQAASDLSYGLSLESNATYNTAYLNIIHNTIRIQSNSTDGRVINMAGIAASNASNISIRKNILVNTGAGYVYYIPANAFSGNLVMNNNNIYAAGPNVGTWNSTTAIANDQLRSWISITNQDSLSGSVAVNFVSASDLRLTTPSEGDFNLADDAGPLANDIDDNPRTNPYSYKGAHEPATMLTLPAAADAGIWKILGPDPVTISSVPKDIRVKLRNNGLPVLTSVNINYTLNGVPGSVYTWTGTLNKSNDIDLVIASVPFTAGNNQLVVWTENTNSTWTDLNMLNDTVKFNFIAAPPLSGSYTVGTGQTYQNLTEVANALRNTVLGNNTVFELTSSYVSSTETFPIRFSAPVSSMPYTVIIRPAAGATGIVTQGDAGSANALIQLDSTTGIMLDGRPGGTGSVSEWTIRNTRTLSTYGPVIRLINGAQYNTFRYLKLESQANSTTTGVIHFSTTTRTLGNSNNTFDNCVIRDRSDLTAIAPSNGVYSLGTDAYPNSNNTITGNIIANTASNGVLVAATGNGNGWNISSNQIYYSSINAPIATGVQTAINFIPGAGSNNNTIAGNTIGGTQANAAGTPWINSAANLFAGIIATVDTLSVTTITGNTIANITKTSTGSGSFAGIKTSTGWFTIANNVIGDSVNASSIQNLGTSTTIGIDMAAEISTVPLTVMNNVVSNVTATTIGSATGAKIRGISLTSSVISPAFQIAHNRISNLSTTGAPTGFAVDATAAAGIYIFPGGGTGGLLSSVSCGVKNNRIWNITAANTGTAATVSSGIAATNYQGEIANNTIYGIRNNSTAAAPNRAIATGLLMRSNGNSKTYNNMIALGWGNSDSVQVNGILIPEGNNAGDAQHYYYNSIVLENTAGNTVSSMAFHRGQNNVAIASARPVMLRNNMFINTITTPGRHYAVAIEDTSVVVSKVSDHNIYFSNNPATIGLWGTSSLNLVNWRSRSQNDSLTKSKAVSFVNTVSANLHLSGSSVGDFDLAGTPVAGIIIDIDGDIRHTTFPYIGADESSSSPLPVQLTSFNAKRTGKDVLVYWTTASEINVDRFVVEASANGQNFKVAGTVKATGNSSAVLSYQLKHFNAQAEMNNAAVIYYRLTIVDKDGSRAQSAVATVTFDKQSNAVDGTVAYPNPFSSSVTLSIPSTVNTTLAIEIMDIRGRVVGHSTQQLTEGLNTITINDLQYLETGIYFVKASANGEQKVIKMIKE